MMNTQRFSADGYIIDQDLFTDVTYRTTLASYNGCGWMAAYNLRHALGQKVYWDDVRREMDGLHTVRFPGPTLMRVMRTYLGKYVPGYKETVGKNEATRLAAISRAGIFRYWEEGIPHFITFVKVPDTDHIFRFFNVNDDILDEKIDMFDFSAGHFVRGSVIALTVE